MQVLQAAKSADAGAGFLVMGYAARRGERGGLRVVVLFCLLLCISIGLGVVLRIVAPPPV